MKQRFVTAVAVSACALVLPVIGPAAQAHAVTCAGANKWTSTTLSSSSKMDATADCDGLYALSTLTADDYVRGWYYKDGAWQLSSYGYQWIGYNVGAKIIGNTVTGRDLKGQAANINQYVTYAY